MATVFDRVNADLERGDLGAARMRLASYIHGCGYDAAVVGELGRISAAMGDPAEAGRYWLISDQSGEEVEAAVALFILRAGGTAAGVASHLPRRARLKSIGDYPAAAQERLVRLGLADAVILREGSGTGSAHDTSSLSSILGWAWGTGCFVLVLFAAASFVIGAGIITRFILRQIPIP